MRRKFGTLLVVLVSFFAGTASVNAQTTPGPRAFDRIIVTGNERFRDGDVLETAGLAPGTVYEESDLIAAVEALQFTGEFQTVRMFSNENVLTIEVIEEPEYSGNLTFGAGYDSDSGVFGSLGLRLNEALGAGSLFDGKLTFAGEFIEADASLSSDRFWGDGRAGGVHAHYYDYSYDDTLFDYSDAAISPFYGFQLGNGGTGEVRLTARMTEIGNVDPAASAIIQAEAGDRFVAGPGLSFRFGDTTDEGGSWAFRLDQDFFFGDADLSRTRVAVSGRLPIYGGVFARTNIEFGTVSGLNGSQPDAADRFTLGGSAMRGFARGGISPRDVCAGCGGGGANVVTDLGGNVYAVARTELVVPLFESMPELEPFVFADIGSVWNVDTAVAPSGTLFDDRELRRSAGIGLSMNTPVGRLSATYAFYIDGQPFDDQAELGLSFSGAF